MKRILLFAASLLLFSCSGSEENPESIKARLAELKDQALEINHQIKILEGKLAEMEQGESLKGTVPVKVELVSQAPFTHYFVSSANVKLEKEALVSPETNGQIKNIAVEKGQHVKKGDLLISLNTAIIRNSIAEVRIALDLAAKLYDKQKSLWEQGIGTELQYLQAKNKMESLEQKLKTLNSQLELSLIRAPFDGIVDDIFAKEGELASPGKPILYLVNLQKLKIEADITESMLPNLSKGDKVRVEFPNYPDLTLHAPIFRTGNYIDPKTRTFKVEIRVDNPKGLVKPNQIATLYLTDYSNPKAITVPSIILKKDSKGTFLFVVAERNGKTFARKLYVETGLSYGDRTLIRSGIEPGSKVIVAGFNMVGNATPVDIRE